jgi:hypothetical protein
MVNRLRILTAIFDIINLLMVSGVTASVAHLPDDHYSAHLSIAHSHADHDYQHEDIDHDHHLHLHLVADLVSYSLFFQARTADAVAKATSSQLVTLYYSTLLPPPNA